MNCSVVPGHRELFVAFAQTQNHHLELHVDSCDIFMMDK